MSTPCSSVQASRQPRSPRSNRTHSRRATAELSPADFNELLTELRAERKIAGDLKFEQVMAVVDNLMPGQIADQRRNQTLNAFLECSRKSLIPTSLAGLNRLDAENEVEELRGRMR